MFTRTLLSLSVLLLNFVSLHGQKVRVSSDKEEYKIEEKIILEFEVKSSVDSVSKLLIDGFFIISGPNQSTSYSIIEGKTEKNFKLKYIIKASRVGKLTITSPLFYIHGEEYTGHPLTLDITGENMTKAEMKKIELDRFRENYIKPKGTLRFVLSDSLGYIETYEGPTWNFVRELTQEEIIQMRKK